MIVSNVNRVNKKCEPYRSLKCGNVSGKVRVPGDKSISHRALMIGGLARGKTSITGMLEGQDVLSTAMAMRALGADIRNAGSGDGDAGIWRCKGAGLGGLREAEHVLDLGNSGTSARLLMGMVAGYDFTTFMTGDSSLRKRPMGRVMLPLEEMGACFMARQEGKFPLAIKGGSPLLNITYESPVASAQVKSAVLLAGLMARGQSCVIESRPSRDHTENMLRSFGAKVETGQDEQGRYYACVNGEPDICGSTIDIPSDPSSAAFPAAAACLKPGSELVLQGVGINPRRTGFFGTLEEMGADIQYTNRREEGGEPVADIKIIAPDILKAVNTPPERVPSMIDEFPVLAILAACADGTSHMSGLAELRVKESDRLELVAKGLKACGVSLETGQDDLTIHGKGRPPEGGAVIQTELDHRIAMSFLVLGSVTDEPVEIDDIRPVSTSFPGFVELMNGIGLHIENVAVNE